MAVDHLDFCLRVHCNFLISGGRNNYNLGDLLGKKKKKKRSDSPKASVQVLHKSFGIKILICL